MNNQIFNVYLKIVLAHVHRKQLPLEDVLPSGLEQYRHQNVDISGSCNFSDFLALLHRLEEVSGDPLFCAEAGSYIHPGDYGPLGTLLMNCDTYGHAITMAYRFQHLINNLFVRQPLVANRAVLSRIEDQNYNSEEIRPYVELEQATLVHMSHFITGHMFREVPITLNFRHQPSGSSERYQEVFNTTTRFNCEFNEIKMPALVLSAPLRSPDQNLFNMVLAQLKQRETELGIAPDLVQQLRIFIRAQMYNKGPMLEQCARLIGTSSSSLKRNLAHQGSSFQDEYDQIRLERAIELLLDEHNSIADVAYIMGFSSSATFSRSFRTWTGVPPSSYRRSHQRIAAPTP